MINNNIVGQYYQAQLNNIQRPTTSLLYGEYKSV